jgi:hypothetical protein
VAGRSSYAVADVTVTVIVENVCPTLIACLINETIYCNVVSVDTVAGDGNYLIRRLGMLEDGDQ